MIYNLFIRQFSRHRVGVFASHVPSYLSMGDDQKKAIPVVVEQPRSTNKKFSFFMKLVQKKNFVQKIRKNTFFIFTYEIMFDKQMALISIDSILATSMQFFFLIKNYRSNDNLLDFTINAASCRPDNHRSINFLLFE